MSWFDMHTHTVFSDGKNTPEEMVMAAIARGMKKIGFSDHSLTLCDQAYCLSWEEIQNYRDTIAELKKKYSSQIQILCGIEQDVYGLTDTQGYDYVIGSAHYIKIGEQYLPVDNTPKMLLDATNDFFGGDIYGFVEAYYQTLSLLADRKDISFIGHFDLVTKFNEGGKLFDENHPRYIAAWQAAADKLLKLNVPFEINTGAISRGYRTTPYPARPILQYLRERGASFLLSSDSHREDTLCYQFHIWEKLLYKENRSR